MADEIVSPQDVHRFWFADAIDDVQAADARNAVWFRTAPAFDREIGERFTPTILAAARGELSTWEDVPRTCVSLAIVLDQFPRNAYRNTAQAFAYDSRALAVARHGVAAGYLDPLSVVERPFLLMPFQHAEDVAVQRESVSLFDRICARAPPEWASFAQNHRHFARLHLEIIERFGRFPHRNAVLGRASTREEREYLASNRERFGQGA
jgi:uncharacterized protein (DUF924 family)